MFSHLRRWMSAPGEEARLPGRIFWSGLIVRLLYIALAHTYRVRLGGDHFGFGWEMGRIARALATGYGFADPFNGHSGPSAWTPPLYPLLLAAVFKVFGVYSAASAFVVHAMDSVFSAATAIAVYEIAWRCFGRTPRGLKIALWSGWLWALYPAAMQYAVHWFWEMSLTTFLFAFVVVFALRLRGIGEPASPDLTTGQTLPRWLAFGALWGVLALSNSSLLLFIPVCGLWIVWPALRQGGHLALILRNALLSGVVCLAFMAPWIARNWVVFHAFVPMRANFGVEFYASLLPSHAAFPWGTVMPLAEADPEFVEYKRIGELAYSRRQAQRAVHMLLANKRRFVGYTLLRTYFFWISVPHPIDRSVTVEVVRELNYAFLSVGALLGLVLALRQRIPGATLFALALAFVPVVYYLITVQARFRHPLEPIMTVLIVYLFQSAELPSEHRRRLLAEAHA